MKTYTETEVNELTNVTSEGSELCYDNSGQMVSFGGRMVPSAMRRILLLMRRDDMTTPKCTIFSGWTGPECGKDAVSLNDYGGFQCEFHDSLIPCKDNKVGPVTRIEKGEPGLQEAYDLYLKSSPPKSATVGSRVTIEAHNAPQSMLRSKG